MFVNLYDSPTKWIPPTLLVYNEIQIMDKWQDGYIDTCVKFNINSMRTVVSRYFNLINVFRLNLSDSRELLTTVPGVEICFARIIDDIVTCIQSS